MSKTFDDAWPSRYLTAADVAGKKFNATIKVIDFEKMKDGTEKPVAYFSGMKKGVVLNKSKGKFLASLSKSLKLDDWVGLEIGISEGQTTYAGDDVACIKFERSANGKATQIKEDLNDDIPNFDEDL